MDSYSGYRCWEIMNCDNLNCPARIEPETPCWEIAIRDGSYPNVPKNCNDCLVYLLKAEASVLNIKKLKKILAQKGFWENITIPHQNCILQSSSIG